jgi:hypothetical protein
VQCRGVTGNAPVRSRGARVRRAVAWSLFQQPFAQSL